MNSDNAWRTSRRATTRHRRRLRRPTSSRRSGCTCACATRAAPTSRRRLAPAAAEPRPVLTLRPPAEAPSHAAPRDRGRHGGAAKARGERGVPAAGPRALAQGRARAVRTRRGRFDTSFVPAFRAAYRYYAVAKVRTSDTDRGASSGSLRCAGAVHCTEGLPALLSGPRRTTRAPSPASAPFGPGCANRGASSGAPRTTRPARSAPATGSEVRPLIWAQPVMPGLTSSRRRWRSV